MDWLNEITYDDLLGGDARIIYDNCGPDVLISLWENLSGMTFYLSGRSLNEIKKRYILTKKNTPEFTVKDIAVKLKVTESFVYAVLRGDNTIEKDERQGSLFE
ncbi:MAG: hypothetical protein L7F77_11355 [Candidatus Magnetominusculus sp. LBB02]|nr:hypothetical protein [Candidatus Magnetominusculus sp. LBB02]